MNSVVLAVHIRNLFTVKLFLSFASIFFQVHKPPFHIYSFSSCISSLLHCVLALSYKILCAEKTTSCPTTVTGFATHTTICLTSLVCTISKNWGALKSPYVWKYESCVLSTTCAICWASGVHCEERFQWVPHDSATIACQARRKFTGNEGNLLLAWWWRL